MTNFRTINEIQKQMAQGELTSEQLVLDALASIDKHSDHHAFITVDDEHALTVARKYDQLRAQGRLLGPLHGIVVSVKDNIHVADLPNTAGTPALKDFIPQDDATVIERLKAAGAIIIGKNNLHELAYGITSDNKAFGAVNNAKKSGYIAGGSSGGTATAVALNMAIAGLGTDTGGSVRIPSALNGIVGFRPSVDRYPKEGLTAISNTRDTVGPITRSVADAKLLDAVLSAQALSDEVVDLTRLRIGVPKAYYYEGLQPEIKQKTASLLQILAQQGVELVYEDIADIGILNEQVSFPVVLFETDQLLQAYVKAHLPQLTYRDFIETIADAQVKGLLEMAHGDDISPAMYQEALSKSRPALQQAIASYFAQHKLDAIIFPTTLLTARPIAGAEEEIELNGEKMPTFPTYIHNTDPATNAGNPALTIPLSQDDKGLPFGIEINGLSGNDQQLLAIGAALETLINNSGL